MKSAPVTSSSCRLYNNHNKGTVKVVLFEKRFKDNNNNINYNNENEHVDEEEEVNVIR